MISAHKTKNGFPKGSFCAVRIEAYNEVLDLLDTLKEPVSEDLEKEIDAYYKEWDGDCRYAQTALHFAQWGAEHPADASKMISEDLEKAADAYVGNHPEIDEGVYTYAKRLAFKAGAKWLAEQGLTQVCRVKADYDSHGADYGVRFLRIDLPDDTPIGEEIIVKIIPKTW